MIFMLKIKSDKIIVGESLFDGYLYVEDGKIAKITAENLPCEESYDYTGKYVSPGFIDLHTHGAGGYPFMDNTVEDVIRGCEAHLAHGTTCILPTVSTGAFSKMREAVINIYKAMESGKVPMSVIDEAVERILSVKMWLGLFEHPYVDENTMDRYENLPEEHTDLAVRRRRSPLCC